MDYSTQMEAAKLGIVTPQMLRVAEKVLDPKEINISVLGSEIKNMKDFSTDQLDF